MGPSFALKGLHMRVACVSLVLLASTAYSQAPVGDGKHIEILRPGPVDAAAEKDLQGAVWWVLFQAPGEVVRLRYTSLTVEPRFNPVTMGFDLLLRADGFPDDEVILLFHGTEELPRGPVSTSFCGQLPLLPGLELALGPGKTVSLEAHTLHRSSPIGLATYRLRLMASGGHGQDLFEAPLKELRNPAQTLGSEFPLLLWAGDLDQDARTDLLLRIWDRHTGPRLKLFLSARAAAGELAGPAATCSLAAGAR